VGISYCDKLMKCDLRLSSFILCFFPCSFNNAIYFSLVILHTMHNFCGTKCELCLSVDVTYFVQCKFQHVTMNN